MEVFVYKGEWNLPSIDPDCLKTLLYIKLTRAPVNIRTGSSTFWSPSGLLPYLTADGRKYAGFKDIQTYLISQGYEISKSNQDFDDNYIAVLRQNLYPYFLYNQWCPQNIDHSRTLYAVRIPFPFNFITPKHYYRKAERMIQSLCNFSLEDNVQKHDFAEMALKAKKVLNELEERLKFQEWAAGKEPGLLDVHVYAFVAVILYNSLPNNALQAHVQQCPSLAKYVQKVTKKFFENDGFMSEKKDLPRVNTEDKTQEEDDDPKERRKRYILSGLVATISMISYALFKGILHISYDDESHDYIDYVLDGEGEDDNEGE